MNPVRELRTRAGLTQKALAAAAATSQPTIAAYETGRKEPALSTLRRLAKASGLEVVVQFVPPLTREDRRSLVLHDAIARELERDPARVQSKARRNLRLMRRANPNAEPLLKEWRVALDRPLEDLTAVLRDPSQRARELRHVTPFAGVLTSVQRADLYNAFREQERTNEDEEQAG